MHTIAGNPCRATRVAADFLDFIAFCRCSSGVAPHPPKIFGVAPSPPPPPFPGGVAPKFGSEKVSRYTGVSQVQLRVSRYTVQLSRGFEKGLADRLGWRKGISLRPCSYAPLMSMRTPFWGLFLPYFGRCWSPTPPQRTLPY